MNSSTLAPKRFSTTTRGLSTARPLGYMPSPRSSPALRPTSPLSPGGFKSQKFDMLQPPSPRSMYSRPGSSQRRGAPNGSLQLPSLPRFHPANYPSAHSSTQSTPDGAGASPQPPVSPRAHQRMYSDAQKQLFHYQREMIAAATRSSSPSQAGKPASPRLAPLGSPGPVTPLELEGDEGYLVAGARSAGKDASTTDELVDKLIGQETKRQRTGQSPSGHHDR